MKNNKLKFLIAILIMFSYSFFISIDNSKAVYREVKSTTLYVSVAAPANTVSVNLHLNGGQMQNTSSPITLNSGDYLNNLETPTRDGHIFLGWYTDSGFTNTFDDTVAITSNMNLYAKWQERPTVTVTLHLNDGQINYTALEFVIYSGDLFDNLVDPTKTGHIFDGWYTDSGFNTVYDDTVPITVNTDLYAKWEVDPYVAEVNGVKYTTLALAIDAVPTGTSSPTTVKILQDIELTATQAIPSNKWVELDIGSYTISGSQSNLFENSGKLNIINGTIYSTHVSGAANVTGTILNKSTGTINISGGLIQVNAPGAGESKPIQNNGGTVVITGGRLECNSKAAVINNVSSGRLDITGGEIIGTYANKGQGIYIAGNAVTNIGGTAYIENVSIGSGNDARAAVDNAGGKLTITGGTIVSKAYMAVNTRASGAETYIGTEDSTIDTTTPVVIGADYALNSGSGSVYVYDGIFKTSKSGATTAYNGTINILSDTQFNNSNSETVDTTTYVLSFLEPTVGSTYTVIFDSDNGDPNTSVSVTSPNNKVGSNMPNNPTKTNFGFEKWFIYKEITDENDNTIIDSSGNFTGSTFVESNITVMAKWRPSLVTATVSPASVSLIVNQTATIEVTGPYGMEDYTFTSSDPSVATVNQNGVITGVSNGTVTITVTGTLSSETKTVSVTITSLVNHTVTFYDTLNGNVVKMTEVGHGTAIGSAGMPSSNPTRQNYVFDDWYIDGDTSNPAFDSTTTITADTDVIANWHEIVTYATVSTNPSPLEIYIGSTGTITLNPTVNGETVESYTCTSNNTNIVTVSNCTVTGVNLGSTTITVTGGESTLTRTVNVEVVRTRYTVTFYDALNGNVIKETSVESGSRIGVNGMPSQNPTKTNYVFDNWYVDGDTSNQPFDSTAVIIAATDVIANWHETVTYATLTTSPSPLELAVGGVGTITLSPTVNGDVVESYSCVSNDTSVVTVNNCTVTGVGNGTTTITITGSKSTITRTVGVTVSGVVHTVTFRMNDGTTYVVRNNVEDETILSTILPVEPTLSGYNFDKWFIVENGVWTHTPMDPTIEVESDLIYQAGFYSNNDVAAIGHEYYATYKLAIDDIPTTGVETEVRLLKDAITATNGRAEIAATKNMLLNGNNHTLTCDHGNAIKNFGTVTLKDVTVTCSEDKNAPIDNEGTLTIINSSVTETKSGSNGRAAIYNTGTVILRSGTISSAASARPTVQNVSKAAARFEMYGGTVTATNASCTNAAVENFENVAATIIIEGGTVTSLSTNVNAAAVKLKYGTLTIGTQDNAYDTTSPIIQGEVYGVNSTTSYSVYDGIIKGKYNNLAVNDDTLITQSEPNSTLTTGQDGSYYTLYYTIP